jgi:hypothetical protein
MGKVELEMIEREVNFETYTRKPILIIERREVKLEVET